jgi:aminopeptidase N
MIRYKKIKSALLIPTFLLLSGIGCLLSETAFAQANRELIDVKSYSFTVELNDSTDVLTGKATLQVSCKKESKLLELDLVTKNAAGKGMEVSAVTFNGKIIPFEHKNNLLRLSVPVASKATEKVILEIHYQGIPANGLIIAKNKFGDRTFFGDNWPNRAHHWLPVIDHPSDKAAVDFVVLTPHHYSVIANGVQVEESYRNAKQKLTHWHETVEIPTKVMVIGVARFAIHKDGLVNHTSVESWVYPQNREIGFSAYNTASQVLDFFSSHLAPYPYAKLANVQSKTMFGGMENASNIFYYENSVSDENSSTKNESLVAHEIAHQWFGNSASESDWHHVWLSEGFATYFTHLYNEFTYGRDKMAADLREDRKTILDFYQQQKLPIVFEQLPSDLLDILSSNSYQKASWVLHMLRNEMGNEAFWKAIRHYYTTYQNRNASTDDFKLLVQEFTDKNLSPFFNQWLHRAGHPKLRLQWTYNTHSQTVEGTIDQLQTEEPFLVTLEIGVMDDFMNFSGIEKVQLSEKTSRFSFKTVKKPTKLVLDPQTKLLFEEKL